MAETTSVLEFNSNVAVLQRCSNIIDAINEARYRTTKKDDYGNVMAEAEEVLSHMICLYKEICVELRENDRKEIWGNLTGLRDRLRIRPPKPEMEQMAYWQKTIDTLDALDIDLRLLAKKHGFLSANKRDITKASLRR